MIVFIDNYDSFTYNLVQYLQELQQDVAVYKNNAISIDELKQLQADAIVLGPGPNTPDEAGISLEIITQFAGVTPILGICLGHQAIGQAFGAKVSRAAQVMHGRVSAVHHNAQFVFANLPSPFNATRYHSLVIDKTSLPSCLLVTAWTEANDVSASAQSERSTFNGLKLDEIMAIRHKDYAIEGVQFHPESILSDYGYHILNNFLCEHGLAKLATETLPISKQSATHKR